jgi:hypothetical protein
MRNCGRRVELTLIDNSTMNPTDVVLSFPSLYKTAKFLDTLCCSVTDYNGTRFKSNVDGNIYLINILDPKIVN